MQTNSKPTIYMSKSRFNEEKALKVLEDLRKDIEILSPNTFNFANFKGGEWTEESENVVKNSDFFILLAPFFDKLIKGKGGQVTIGKGQASELQCFQRLGNRVLIIPVDNYSTSNTIHSQPGGTYNNLVRDSLDEHDYVRYMSIVYNDNNNIPTILWRWKTIAEAYYPSIKRCNDIEEVKKQLHNIDASWEAIHAANVHVESAKKAYIQLNDVIHNNHETIIPYLALCHKYNIKL